MREHWPIRERWALLPPARPHELWTELRFGLLLLLVPILPALSLAALTPWVSLRAVWGFLLLTLALYVLLHVLGGLDALCSVRLLRIRTGSDRLALAEVRAFESVVHTGVLDRENPPHLSPRLARKLLLRERRTGCPAAGPALTELAGLARVTHAGIIRSRLQRASMECCGDSFAYELHSSLSQLVVCAQRHQSWLSQISRGV